MRRALVTGCNQGIGLSACKSLSQHGYRVIGVDINPFPFEYGSNKNTFNDTEGQSSPIHEFYQADLSTQAGLTKLCKNIDKIDVLVNNAGRFDLLSIQDTSLDIFKYQLDLNITAPFALIQHVLPYMQMNKYGRIINIASQKGLKGAALHSAYCSSKHALIGLTKSVAIEMATFGITCNAICPGWVATPPLLAEFAQKAKQNGLQLEEQIKLSLKQANQPNTNIISPEDIAKTILFLASDAASQITGQAISQDCGNGID